MTPGRGAELRGKQAGPAFPCTPNQQQAVTTDTTKEVLLLASGDLRLAANQNCWPAQQAMEEQLGAALARQGWRVKA